MITINLCSANGDILASATHADEAMLCVDRIYEPGDSIAITSDCTHIVFQADTSLLPAQVYIPGGKMAWRIPCGEHRLAYNPYAFEGKRHLITARAMNDAETKQRRNIACNPADLRGETDFYPHCTANVETRRESCFAARNVIDGIRINTSHGEWPYQSWGIGAREDAWCMLDFGRVIETDRMALTLRADFPHDAYWTSGHVVMSDGTDFRFALEKTTERQYIDIGIHQVSWMRLENMVKSDDPSAFPSLSQWEVFGKDVF